MLTGHTIYLRKARLTDVREDGWLQWYNDPDLTRSNSHGVFPVSLEEEKQIVQANLDDKNSIVMSICRISDDHVIGNISIQAINWINRSCRLAITIGEPTLTAGVEAFGLMTQHAFEKLNLNRIADTTHQNVEAFLHMISVFGYRIEGRGRENFIHGDQRSDSIMFACLSQDWFAAISDRKNWILYEDIGFLKREIIEAAKLKGAKN